MTEADSPESSSHLEVVRNKEIERKFRVGTLPENLYEFEKKYIDQGYIAVEESGAEVRLRCMTKPKEGGSYTMAVKSGSGRTRFESEIELTFEQYHELWPVTEGRRIQKTRYRIPYVDSVIELDVYDGNLNGLVVAEVEFTDETSADNFTVPQWFGAEVTENPAFKNQQLALNGWPQ